MSSPTSDPATITWACPHGCTPAPGEFRVIRCPAGLDIRRADPVIAASGELLREMHAGRTVYSEIRCVSGLQPGHPAAPSCPLVCDTVTITGLTRRLVYRISAVLCAPCDMFELSWPD